MYNRISITKFVRSIPQISLCEDLSTKIRRMAPPKIASNLIARPPSFYTDPYERDWAIKDKQHKKDLFNDLVSSLNAAIEAKDIKKTFHFIRKVQSSSKY